MRQRPLISALVPTRNEEANLPFLLPTLSWCDEVIIIDQGSGDETRSIAREFGAHILEEEWRPDFDAVRQKGAEVASGDWILAVDADEMIPRTLAHRLRDLAETSDVDIIRVPRLNYFLGPYQAGGFWPDWQFRFFRQGAIDLSGGVHTPFKPASERILQLPADPKLAIHHFGYRGAASLLSKLNRYTDLELEKETATDRRQHQFLRKPIRIFLSRYVRYGGWRHGVRGLWLSVYWALYAFVTSIKRWERDALPASEASERTIRRGILDDWSAGSEGSSG